MYDVIPGVIVPPTTLFVFRWHTPADVTVKPLHSNVWRQWLQQSCGFVNVGVSMDCIVSCR